MSDIRRNFFNIIRGREGNLIEIPLPRSYLAGLGTSNGTDTAHDIDFAVGEGRDSTDAFNIKLASVLTKQLDQPWAVGSAAGGLGTDQIDGAQTVSFLDASPDTITIDAGTWDVTPTAGDTVIVNGSGSGNDGTYQVVSSTTSVITLGNTDLAATEATSAATVHLIVDDDTYHMHAIRADDSPGSVADIGFDISATATNLLSNSGYAYFQRIGSLKTESAANIRQYKQRGDEFSWLVPTDTTDTNPGVSAVTRTVDVPSGVVYKALLTLSMTPDGVSSLAHDCLVTALNLTDTAVTANLSNAHYISNGRAGAVSLEVETDTSNSIRFRLSGSGANVDVVFLSRGWIDRRGRDD